jgi:hypothetical protein
LLAHDVLSLLDDIEAIRLALADGDLADVWAVLDGERGA